MTDAVGLVSHDSSFEHDAGPGHPERTERISAILEHLDAAGLAARLDRHEPEMAPREVVELAHHRALVDLLTDLDAAGGGRIDLDTGMGPASLEAALRGTQGVIDAAARVLDGSWRSAFVCIRPPGHHATRSRPMGFCLTNHVAVAARWAVETGRASRVLILDWDAHHGNGTQDVFWDDPSVLYVSIHQYPWYPGTGDATETGEGPGRGCTLNVPLPAGAAEDAYARAFDELIGPVALDFGADLVLVSSGFDAHRLDPLCMLRLQAGAYFRLTERTGALGRGPVCVLEGGYDLEALAWSAAATVSALLGEREPVGIPAAEVDPLEGEPDAHRWVDRAIQLYRRSA